MSNSRVAIVRCNAYQDETVLDAVRKGINLLGGISGFVKAGERIVMKPNVLIGSDPAKSVTTHPAVLTAVGKMLREAGAAVSYGDSPAVGGCEFSMKRAGLKRIGDELGFTVADFDHGREVSHPAALLNKKFTFSN